MYEELINSLRYCATHSCMGEAPALTGCTAIYDDAPKDCDSCNAVLQWQAADAIDKQNVIISGLNETIKMYANETPQWIPVTERLPYTFEEVLVCTESYGETVAVFDGAVWLDAWARNTYLISVTHWMPLPAPPALDTDKQP